MIPGLSNITKGGSHRDKVEVDGKWKISFLTFLIVYFSFYISYGCPTHAMAITSMACLSMSKTIFIRNAKEPGAPATGVILGGMLKLVWACSSATLDGDGSVPRPSWPCFLYTRPDCIYGVRQRLLPLSVWKIWTLIIIYWLPINTISTSL